jgi:hypothetical protein
MYYTWIKHINLFNIRNLNARAIFGKSFFLIIFAIFVSIWCIPFADFLLLISYICVVEIAKFFLKSHLDYAHLLFCPAPVFNKFFLMYILHLSIWQFLFFLVITIMSVINGYFNIFHTLILLIVLLIPNLITLNLNLTIIRNIILSYIIKAFYSIMISFPFILIYDMENIRDRLTDFYENNMLLILSALIILLLICFIPSYCWFKYIVCRKPFPSPGVIARIRKGIYI